jgi:hypothetical protein
VKVGDLVRVDRVHPRPGSSELGVIVGIFDHPTATSVGHWFEVAVKSAVLVFREEYLEVVNESR